MNWATRNKPRATANVRTLQAGMVALAVACAGCFSGPYMPPPGQAMAQPGQPMPGFGAPALVSNPMFIPVQDPNLLWDQLIDVTDDYFEVDREDRVKLVGDILTEGRIDTFPRGASTIFEPWNKDSVTPRDRWHATLQSLRRQGTIRVIPAEGGFLVDVVVNRELEDVDRPDAVFTGNESLRNDNSIRRFTNNAQGGGQSMGWIGQGRDLSLDQEILLQLQARFFNPNFTQPPVFVGENPPAQPVSNAEWKPTPAESTIRR
jgi:hypothetical protein